MEINWRKTTAEIGPRLFHYFAGSFRQEEAADLTQETLFRLVRKVEDGSFDPQKGTLIMFAYGIARLVRMEAWKAAPPEVPMGDAPLPDVSSAQDENLYLENQLTRLRGSILELNETQKEILLLHIDQDLTLSEIGTLIGLPLNTVKSHIYRAKEILRERLVKETK